MPILKNLRVLPSCMKCRKITYWEGTCPLCTKQPKIECSNCHKDRCECLSHHDWWTKQRKHQRVLNAMANIGLEFGEVSTGRYRTTDGTITFFGGGKWIVGDKRGSGARNLQNHIRKLEGKKPIGQPKVMEFGKYRGTFMRDVPDDYLEWCVENFDDGPRLQSIQAELQRRVEDREPPFNEYGLDRELDSILARN